MTQPTRPLFGGKAGHSGGGVFEHYIKTFREKRTELTFAFKGDPKEEGVVFSYREHFDHTTTMPGARSAGVSYGCAKAEGADNCIGCDFPVEHPEWTNAWLKTEAGKKRFGESFTAAKENRRKADFGWGIRDASGKWVLPCIDAEGNVNLFKIGWNFLTHLSGLIEEVGPLHEQRFVVLKTGTSFNDTAYSALPTGKPPWTTERDIPPFSEIADLLGKKYLEAFGVYVEKGLTNEDGTPTGEAAPDPDQGSQDPEGDAEAQEQRAPTPTTDALKEKAAADGPKMPHGLDGLDIPEGWDPFLAAREATPTQLKEWLDNDPRGANDYPARAPKSVLVSLVEKAQVPF
jgi:hypothetical protein